VSAKTNARAAVSTSSVFFMKIPPVLDSLEGAFQQAQYGLLFGEIDIHFLPDTFSAPPFPMTREVAGNRQEEPIR
jgi:hypothetical protein